MTRLFLRPLHRAGIADKENFRSECSPANAADNVSTKRRIRDVSVLDNPSPIQYDLPTLPPKLLRLGLDRLPLETLIDFLSYFSEHHVASILNSAKGGINASKLLGLVRDDGPRSSTESKPEFDAKEFIENMDSDSKFVKLKYLSTLADAITDEQDTRVFEAICKFGLIDGDIEVRSRAINCLHVYKHTAGSSLSMLNRQRRNSPICGVFIYALEDEFSSVRLSALKAMESFALASFEFARLAIDHISDMLNDEIEQIRIQAINSITSLLSTYPDMEITDFEDLLSSLEERSADIRRAFRGLLRHIRVRSASTIKAILTQGLIKNLLRYPEDESDLRDCCAVLGRNHQDLVMLVHGELLDARLLLTKLEPDTDDQFYILVLIFVVNGLFTGQSDMKYDGPYDLPFLSRHIAGLRIMDHSLLPESIANRQNAKADPGNWATLFESAVNACELADQLKSPHLLDEAIETFKSFEDNPVFQDTASFYTMQTQLRSYL